MRKASGIRGPFDVADKIDRTLFVVAILLLFISVILIASSSVMESQKLYGDEFYLLKKHVLSIVAALTLAFIAGMIPSYLWEKMSFKLMIAVVVLLVSVLIFGRTVNAARRWISLGPVNLQPAELLKLCWIIYLSSFVSRKMVEVRTKLKGFFKPLHHHLCHGLFAFKAARFRIARSGDGFGLCVALDCGLSHVLLFLLWNCRSVGACRSHRL